MHSPPRLTPVAHPSDDALDADDDGRVRRIAPAQRRIGAILVDLSVLRLEQAERVLEAQRERGGRFGDLAVGLGYVSRAQVDLALARQRGAPVLLPGDRVRFGPGLRATVDDPRSMRAWTDARTQLELRWFGESPERRALAVLGEMPGEGRTLATCVIGLLLAMTGRRVLLIDACIDSPGIVSTLGGSPPSIGLAEALAQPEAALRLPSAFESVDVSVLGPAPGTVGADATASLAFASMLSTLSAGWDAILVDTPAWSIDRRALSVAVRCSGALVVARLMRSRVARLEAMRRMLADAGVETVGAIAHRF